MQGGVFRVLLGPCWEGDGRLHLSGDLNRTWVLEVHLSGPEHPGPTAADTVHGLLRLSWKWGFHLNPLSWAKHAACHADRVM